MANSTGAEGMNSEKIAEFNRKCAEYMGFVPLSCKRYVFTDDGDFVKTPDYYHDANDRNKVLEKAGIETFCIVLNGNKAWTCGTDSFPKIYVDNISMEAAQIACIDSALGVNQ